MVQEQFVHPGAVVLEHGSVKLRVQAADGKIAIAEFPGLSTNEAIRAAVSRGLRVLSIEAGSSNAGDRVGAQARPASSLLPGASAFPLLLFSQELLALLEAGLHLTESLQALLAKEFRASSRKVLSELLQALREGKNFSDTLAAQPRHFPEVYVATVRAAERTGDLPRTLARYIGYQLQFEVMRKKLVTAALYPAMLLAVGGFVALFLLGYVVPRFSTVYESSGRDIPWMSNLLLTFGRFIDSHWLVMGCVGLLALGVLGATLGRPDGRAFLLRQCLRFPWLSRQADAFRLARFFRAVGLLLTSGIALPRALGMVTGLLGTRQQVALRNVRLAVEQGRSLSMALAGAGLSDPIADSLLKVGERSGQLADMLERTARFQDERMDRWVEWASKLLEPLLMMFIGLVIGSVVVLLYLPIFELAGSLGVG